MLFDYCLFYWGRFIPSHGEVHSVFISHGVEWEEEEINGGEEEE
jgi:hypothetical protein